MARIRSKFDGTVFIEGAPRPVKVGEEIEVNDEVAADLCRPERQFGFEPVAGAVLDAEESLPGKSAKPKVGG